MAGKVENIDQLLPAKLEFGLGLSLVIIIAFCVKFLCDAMTSFAGFSFYRLQVFNQPNIFIFQPLMVLGFLIQ